MSALTKELGFTNAFPGMLSAFSQWDMFEQVPELLWPNSVRTYTRMWREDSRVASVYYAIALPVQLTPWRVDPNGARDEVVEFVAANLGLPIAGDNDPKPKPRTRDRFSWSKHLQVVLRHLLFGHQVFEQVYRIDDKGRANLRKLAPRPSSTIAFWDVALDGGLQGIQQWPPGTSFGAPLGNTTVGMTWAQWIPVDRLVVYVRDPDPGVWVGNSLLRPAYKHWLLKDEFIRIEATAARRNGVGVPVVTAPESVSQAAIGSADLQPYLDIAQQYRGGNTAGVALPYGTAFELAGVQGNLPSGFIRQAVEYHDKQMALAALAHFLNLDRGGSYALASVQADTFSQGVQQVADDIRDTAQAHVVEDLVDINFGVDEGCPLLTVDEIGSRQDASAAALQMLVGAGLITPDPELEAFERQQMGLPAPDPDLQEANDQQYPKPEAPAITEPIPTAAPALPFSSRARVSASARRRPVTIHPEGQITLW
ncbi:phage portal protein family protein [Mycobacterium europaeum]